MPFDRTPERAATLNRRLAADISQREADAGRALHPLVGLQRQVGNAQVARMLAMRQEEDKEEATARHDLTRRADDEEEMQANHDVAMRAGADEEEVQANHDVAMRAETDEEEAQARHDVAMRQEEENDEAQAMHDIAMRQEEENDEAQAMHDIAMRQEEEKDKAQARPKVGLEGGALSDGLTSRINSRRGGGQALDDNTRSTMESSFGTSFKDVRVHTDAEADSLNRSISARAFTTGNDIFFRKDASPGDHALLAHELTHVVQQRGSTGGGGGGMRVGPAGDSHEVAADSMSTAVISGVAVQAQREADEAAAQRMLVQRQAEEEQDEQAG